MIERGVSEKVLLFLNLLGSICIFPFAILRWHYGDITLAIVDGIISITLLVFFSYIFITRKTAVVRILNAIFLAIALLTSIAIKGQSQILWVAPTIIAIHYLVPVKHAKIINTILLSIMLIIVFPHTELIEFITILSTTILTASLSFVMFRAYNNKQRELALLATIDPLTASGNRRLLETKLSGVIANQSREQFSMCLILLDLDGFKDINDEYGHAIGDQIIISVCNLVKEHTRVLDSLYRYGGDEFIIAPLSMNLKTAKHLAEKIRHIVENHKFIHDIKLTLSIGVSEYNIDDTPESWISRADISLYKAKNNGRNKVY
ncbi:GGDEF domain-containing protein [Colwellia sp. BRX10-3]|uniref:GGDEF domain-containing protein n=1 Tax=Colwellia sp. BRX10-3 TaxID=2759844 RepID=UPI0015F4789F|nr:GGDEF domain-containing protein [Colwellia sp. BRX10-3]MBA6390536.1 GGDEF domain-containing protein [Colwellia sp. BRX10-3]